MVFDELLAESARLRAHRREQLVANGGQRFRQERIVKRSDQLFHPKQRQHFVAGQRQGNLRRLEKRPRSLFVAGQGVARVLKLFEIAIDRAAFRFAAREVDQLPDAKTLGSGAQRFEQLQLPHRLFFGAGGLEFVRESLWARAQLGVGNLQCLGFRLFSSSLAPHFASPSRKAPSTPRANTEHLHRATAPWRMSCWRACVQLQATQRCSAHLRSSRAAHAFVRPHKPRPLFVRPHKPRPLFVRPHKDRVELGVCAVSFVRPHKDFVRSGKRLVSFVSFVTFAFECQLDPPLVSRRRETTRSVESFGKSCELPTPKPTRGRASWLFLEKSMSGKSVGKLTAADARDDEFVLAAVGEITGLAVESVRAELCAVHGASQVRNVFEEWPKTAEQLSGLNVKVAREYGLRRELCDALNLSRRLVSRRLNSNHGRKLLRNAFWDHWPDPEASQVNGVFPGPIQVSDSADADTLAGLIESMGAEEITLGDVPRDHQRSSADRVGDNPGKPSDSTGGEATESGEDDSRDTVPGDLFEAGPLVPGMRLSERYTIKSKLGEGGFGTSWLASDQLTGLDLVLKVPHEEDYGAVRNEMRQAFKILHPNICQAFPDRDDDTGEPFLVMPYGGDDLTKRIGENGSGGFPLTLSLHVLVSVADALDYLHEQLVLHLDVSPGNILIDEDDFVRLTDFGASARARAETDASGNQIRVATSLHSLNAAYAAPEVFAGQARSRSDQYSLFRVLLSMLQGKVQTSPEWGFEPLPYLTERQNEILKRALSREPDERFESCSEPARAFADELARVSDEKLASDVEMLCSRFVHRVQRERQRLGCTTQRLGGALRLGQGLERILRAALVWLARKEDVDALLLLKMVDDKATSLSTTNTGSIVKALLKAAASSPRNARAPEIAPIVEDLMKNKKHSAISKLLYARNDVVHGRRPADVLLPYAERAAAVFSQVGEGSA